jgi:hypothetical protein
MNKSLKLFWIITSAVLVAFVLWFIVLPTFFNAGSSLLKSVFPKEEVKFEAFSPEAFAYDLGDTWEVNATVNVRGFEEIEVEDELSASLDFSVDFVNPEGEVTENIFSDAKEAKDKEINYLQLETQFEIDSTYAEGIYKIIFNIKDNNTSDSTTAEVEVKLEK